MEQLSASDLVRRVQSTLERHGKDYQRWIRDFGQVAASERRRSGGTFTLRDHVRGLVLAQLSRQRPWGPIAANLESLESLFLGFDPDALSRADPEALALAVTAIRCGNRGIRKQLAALRGNISTLARLEREQGTLDRFVESASAHEIARRLSDPGPDKLVQLGYTLALEYLRNVGVRAGKPDVHIRRILGAARLGFSQSQEPSEAEASLLIDRLAVDAGCNPTYLDNLLWAFCAQDYGGICGARPRCGACALRSACRYGCAAADPGRSTISDGLKALAGESR